MRVYNQHGESHRPVVLKLRIDGAVVKCAGSNKMRTNGATVLGAWTVKEVIKLDKDEWRRLLNKKIKNTKKRFYSIHDLTFLYRVGDVVRPNNGFNTNIYEVCGAGIHFYLTKKEAANH